MTNLNFGYLISPKDEREAPDFRHGEERGCGGRRLELSIGVTILFVNRFAIFVANARHSCCRCCDVK